MNKQTDPKRCILPLLLLITLLLIVGGLVITIVKQTPSPVRTVLICIGYLLVLYYALLGYKKPHGNILRYTMLFFAILIIFLLVVDPALKSSSAQPFFRITCRSTYWGEALMHM